jgi:hypothetical protein
MGGPGTAEFNLLRDWVGWRHSSYKIPVSSPTVSEVRVDLPYSGNTVTQIGRIDLSGVDGSAAGDIAVEDGGQRVLTNSYALATDKAIEWVLPVVGTVLQTLSVIVDGTDLTSAYLRVTYRQIPEG